MKPRRRICWTRLASRDLDQAHAYLKQRNPRAARHFAAQILDGIDTLLTHPELGAVAHDIEPRGRYRQLLIERHRVIYRIEDELIWIVRVWDMRRDPNDLLPEG